MKLANRLDRTILVVGIGITTFLLLWSMSTETAKAGELEPSTVPAGSPVSGASQVELPAWVAWREPPTRLPWPHRREQPLSQCGGGKRKQARRRRKGGPARPVSPSEQTSESSTRPAERAATLKSSVQRIETNLSEGQVVSTAMVDMPGLPLTVWIAKPLGVTVTAMVCPASWVGSEWPSAEQTGQVGSSMVVRVRWVSVSTATLTVMGQVSAENAACQCWVAREMAALDLGDQRLNRRARCLVEQFAAHSTASIPGACGNWANSKAAYRFFDNAKVTHAAIVAGHRPACLERIRHEELVLVVQDTTSLDYTHHPNTQGLGVIDSTFAQGVMVHTSLAVSGAGVPLGLLAQQVWARAPEEKGQWKKRKQRPIEDKESFKWIAAQRASLQDWPGQVCVITVADREADVYELFQETQETSAQFVIRASWNRRLKQPAGDLWGTVAGTPVRGEFIVEVGRAPDRLPRQAHVQVRFLPVTLKPPSRPACQKIKLKPVHLYAIEVRELNPPAEAEPLHWLLLTNRLIETFEQARQCVRWYCLRWLVERYHYVLKSGCHIEARQLQTAKRLERCLGIYAIVAWRLLWLTYQARHAPTLPCTVALQPHEWQALYCYIHKTSLLPDGPPSLQQATRWIAQLGGFLGRKHDGEPGAKVLWRGWQRLNDMAETWQLAHPTTEKDVGNV